MQTQQRGPHSSLDRLLQSVAGYLELNMTLLAGEMEPEQAHMEITDQSDAGEGNLMFAIPRGYTSKHYSEFFLARRSYIRQ